MQNFSDGASSPDLADAIVLDTGYGARQALVPELVKFAAGDIWQAVPLMYSRRPNASTHVNEARWHLTRKWLDFNITLVWQ
eukprot:15475270-Alexandrium_andersonii.AAC.1